MAIHSHVSHQPNAAAAIRFAAPVPDPTPLPAARCVPVSDAVMRRVRVFLRSEGYLEKTEPGSGRIEIRKHGLSGRDIRDGQEKLLKDLCARLHVDLIGSANVTRLDAMLGIEHPRLTYRRAIEILNDRGFGIEFGDVLDREAEKVLVRHCGNLPVHVTGAPGSSQSSGECDLYILPFAGGVSRGSAAREGFDLDLKRLLRYVLGRESIGDCRAC